MDYVPRTYEDHARHILLGTSSYQGASMLIKRSFFEKALPIPEGVNYHDSWFAALACFSGGLKYINDFVMRYRRCENSITLSLRKKPPFRIFIGNIIVNHALQDRLTFVYNIKKRVENLSCDQLELLDIIERMLIRRKTLIGRIKNIPYYLKNFKAIYAFDGKHLFI